MKTALEFEREIIELYGSVPNSHMSHSRKFLGNIIDLNRKLGRLEAERRIYRDSSTAQVALVNMIEYALDLLRKQILIDRLSK